MSFYYLQLGAILLFACGSAIVFTRRSPLIILIGIELMLNGACLAAVGFSLLDTASANGQVIALFYILVAAAETALVLAIVYNLTRKTAPGADV
jgi:NADH:ubiquinone oxidoreductase subunit K